MGEGGSEKCRKSKSVTHYLNGLIGTFRQWGKKMILRWRWFILHFLTLVQGHFLCYLSRPRGLWWEIIIASFLKEQRKKSWKRKMEKSKKLLFLLILVLLLTKWLIDLTSKHTHTHTQLLFLQCVSGIWTRVTWPRWFGFRLKSILGNIWLILYSS